MIEKLNSYSKEAIKVRMLQNAVKIWGLKSVNSIDPFVSLLIDSFSTEIFKANNEIQAANSRILEKLAKLLTPSIYTYPQPAHAIAHAAPHEAVEVLPGYNEFFLKKQLPSSAKSISDVQVDIHFTPVDTVRLLKMDSSIMITSNMCYHIDEERNKLPVLKVPAMAVPHNKIIVGIDCSEYVETVLPERLALYCSNPTFEYIDFVFNLLPFITVSMAGQPLEITSGLTYENKQRLEGYEEIFREYSMQTRLEQNIKNIYKNKFIEVLGLNKHVISDHFPTCLSFLKESNELAWLIQDKKMIWLEMDFPPQYSKDILENFFFTLNAFPIYNRKWKRNEYALNVMGDNVPLATDVGEHFLYVEKVEDGLGHTYKEIPFHQGKDKSGVGLFTVRKGGMERFNERNALELIANVLELTRDEVSAFGVLNRDKVVDALMEMTAQMRLLDQRVVNSERSIMQEINYAIVNPYEHVEHLKASYWITQCTIANGLRNGTILSQSKITDVGVGQNIRLLTTTVGGTEEQKGTNAIQAYKYALTTRDKLISIEDIKSFCFLELERANIKSVIIKRGTIISSRPKEGFIKTLEIEITPQHYAHYGEKYWDNMALTLKHKILHRGIDGIEYIVKIINADEE